MQHLGQQLIRLDYNYIFRKTISRNKKDHCNCLSIPFGCNELNFLNNIFQFLETCKHAGVGMEFFCILLESSSLTIPSTCSSTKKSNRKIEGCEQST